MSRKLLVTSALVALTSTVAFLSAQQDPADRTTRDDQAAGQHMLRNPDQMLASCVAVSNQEEIAIAEFARQKIQNEDVKKFAETMITDHHTFLLKLRKYAPEATQPGYLDAKTVKAARAEDAEAAIRQAKIQLTAATEDAEDDPPKGARNAAERRSKDSESRGISFSQLERELAAECLAMTKAKLGEKSEAEFDQCFLGQQIGMHMALKSKLVVFQRHVSDDLAKVFADGQKTTEHHLAKAEELAKSLGHSTTTIEKSREGKNRDKRVIKEKTTD